MATILGDSTYRMTTPGIYYASVTNSVATKLTLNSIPVKATHVLVSLCPLSAPITIHTGVSNIPPLGKKSLEFPYHWEESQDSVNFNYIFDNANFIGTQTPSLQLQNIPS